MLGSLVFSLVSWFLPDAELYAWSWRLPFLFSIVLVIVGLWIRFTIAEPPKYQPIEFKVSADMSNDVDLRGPNDKCPQADPL